MDKIKTAAYCRVSTDKEAQDGSYELQVSYFTELITSNPDMELVGIYGDKGKSGLSTEKRPGLKKLMDDCREGKINLILTKSISRFARNMAECAEMIRKLQSLGVNIIFEKENLNSQDENCALALNIFAAIAEEESHSISQHALRAHEQYTMEGRPFGQISFGYKNGGDNKWIINEEEAPLVRKAFERAAEGQNYTEIRKAMTEMAGYPWSQGRVKYLLTNVVYKGDYHSHATVCLMPGKQVKNNGVRDRFYITEHHEPIVSPELFDWVQIIIKRGILLSYKRLSKEDMAFLKGGAHIVENSNNN
jgi:DNA invertase Pin-like site-specific DNA recombinase